MFSQGFCTRLWKWKQNFMHRCTVIDLSCLCSCQHIITNYSRYFFFNVWCIKFRSKRSNNTVLCLLRNLMHQTLNDKFSFNPHLFYSLCRLINQLLSFKLSVCFLKWKKSLLQFLALDVLSKTIAVTSDAFIMLKSLEKNSQISSLETSEIVITLSLCQFLPRPNSTGQL